MFYHVRLKFSPAAARHFGEEGILLFDETDRQALVDGLFTPINQNRIFNFRGYRNIDPAQFTYIGVWESEMSSVDWAKQKVDSNPPGVLMLWLPTMITGSEDAREITAEVLK